MHICKHSKTIELYSLVITVEILHEYAHIHTGNIHINLETNKIIILAYATAVWIRSAAILLTAIWCC